MVNAQVTELAAGIDVINNLGLDTLTFLAATVLIVPTFKALKQSPVCNPFHKIMSPQLQKFKSRYVHMYRL